MREPFFTYRARCEEVFSGDTLLATLDCGFGISHRTRLALVGIDAHDPADPSGDEEAFKKGRAEAAFVSNWAEDAAERQPDDDWPLVAMTLLDPAAEPRTYEAAIFRKDTGESLNDQLKKKFPDIAT